MLPADWFLNWFKPHEIVWNYCCVKYDDVNILRSLPLATLKGMKWTTKEIEILFVKCCMQKMNLPSSYSTAQAKRRWKHVFSVFIRWMWSRFFAIYISHLIHITLENPFPLAYFYLIHLLFIRLIFLRRF